ncbi:sulfite exporter TauE/SafE family protein, partial [Candidatus Poribacteria bacterium]|nr:sulfite exporter TauE/SafE family protein [Candidatus Poribacteria bacterium]
FGAFLSAAAVWIWVSQRASVAPANLGATDGHRRKFSDADGVEYDYAYSRPLGVGISATVGFVGSLLGVGGGIILVPSFVRWLNFPPKVATATSQLMVMIYALSAVTLHLSIGSLREHAGQAAMLLVGAVVGAQIGARLSRRVRGKALLRVLAAAVAVVGAQLILRAMTG